MNWQFPYYRPGQSPDWDRMQAELPWLRDMIGVPQDPYWHAEGDVWVHTRMVTEALLKMPDFQALPETEQHILFTAALLHDVEKRSTTTTELIEGQERIVSPRHAKKGEYTAREILYRDLPTPFAVREQICKLVRLHGLPLWAIDKPFPAREVIRASLLVNTRHLALLARADILGRICQDQDELLLRIEFFADLCREQACWDQARAFQTDYQRFHYLNRPEDGPVYVPYDDLRFEVYCMCGLPGSGKDSYIRRHLDLPVLSLDEIRRSHNIDPADKKGNGQVIQMGKEQAREYMRQGQSFVFNATNISRDMRGRWLSLFTEYGGRVKIIYVEVPYRQLMRQNQQRAHCVPEAVIERLLSKLEMPGPEEAHQIHWQVAGN